MFSRMKSDSKPLAPILSPAPLPRLHKKLPVYLGRGCLLFVLPVLSVQPAAAAATLASCPVPASVSAVFLLLSLFSFRKLVTRASVLRLGCLVSVVA